MGDKHLLGATDLRRARASPRCHSRFQRGVPRISPLVLFPGRRLSPTSGPSGPTGPRVTFLSMDPRDSRDSRPFAWTAWVLVDRWTGPELPESPRVRALSPHASTRDR